MGFSVINTFVFVICSTLSPTYDRKIILRAHEASISRRRSIPDALSRIYVSFIHRFILAPRSWEKQMCKVERTRCNISFTAIALSRTSWISSFQYFLVLRAFETLILFTSLFLSLRCTRRASTVIKPSMK